LGREEEIIEPDYLAERVGIVVVLDALGMKRALLEYAPSNIFEKWTKVTNNFEYEIMHRNNNCFFRVFSDTIIITCYNINNQNIKNSIDFLGNILINNFINGILNNIFFRGTLAYGKYSESTRLVLGDAINKATACHEKTNWVGISLFPDINYGQYNTNSDKFINYNIPYKEELSTFSNGFALNWVNNKSVDCYRVLKDKQRQYEGTNYSKYYINTIRFFEYIINSSENELT
jgi:hypothetical protein